MLTNEQSLRKDLVTDFAVAPATSRDLTGTLLFWLGVTMRYRDLRVGQAFTFIGADGVYVRCRGGFRPGLGGKLLKANEALAVELYV